MRLDQMKLVDDMDEKLKMIDAFNGQLKGQKARENQHPVQI